MRIELVSTALLLVKLGSDTVHFVLVKFFAGQVFKLRSCMIVLPLVLGILLYNKVRIPSPA